MPMVWEKSAHVEAQAALKARTEEARQVVIAKAHTHLESCSSIHVSNMRNYVIKALCGFNTCIMTKFIVYYPTMHEEWTELEKLVLKILIKARATNQQITKQSHK